MSKERIYLISTDTKITTLLDGKVLTPAGYDVTILQDCATASQLIRAKLPDLVLVGERVSEGDGIQAASSLQEEFPGLAVVYLMDRPNVEAELTAYRAGIKGCLSISRQSAEITTSIQNSIQQNRRLQDWVNLQARRSTRDLQRRLDGMEALQRLGQTVTSVLDLDGVLKVVVDAAVELTGAEEGSLLLMDDATGELYMRASRNFNEDFVRTFRLPINDTIPGEVLRTGRPLFLQETTPKKIKTSYLVYHLVYVPLSVQGRVIGVLGVDNRHSGSPFQENHITLMSALADYAAIAIENANLYSRTEVERRKLETILTGIGDGVLVVDHLGSVVLANPTFVDMFKLDARNLSGRKVNEVIEHQDLRELLSTGREEDYIRSEVALEDGRVFNASVTHLHDVGYAVILQDITHLKELDRIKSEFVATVSHDLRSPLTAILGYVELIERVGKVNEQQHEFIRRVQFSVSNITNLINDLLDLGRIEAGFDSLKEVVPFGAIVRYALEGARSRWEEKGQEVVINLPESLPSVLGNPIRLRQMAANLIGNAVKYTPVGGKIQVITFAEQGQVIFRVQDNGQGIPPSDQPYVFDKFFRASNVPLESQGTGLGLAIVKSIVENHQGRIWLDSAVGHGSTFTVVLPIATSAPITAPVAAPASATPIF